MKNDYVVIDTVSMFKQRYIIPREELQKLILLIKKNISHLFCLS